MNHKENFINLYEIADIYSGIMINRSDFIEKNNFHSLNNKEYVNKYTYLPQKAINQNNIDFKESKILFSKKIIDKKYIARKNDIIMKLTTPYDVFIFLKDFKEDLIISSKFAIIRLKNNVKFSPLFLSYCLNSYETKRQLHKFVEGTSLSILKIHSLKKIKIKQIDLKKQEKFSKLFFLLNQKKELDKQKSECENQLIYSIMYNL